MSGRPGDFINVNGFVYNTDRGESHNSCHLSMMICEENVSQMHLQCMRYDQNKEDKNLR